MAYKITGRVLNIGPSQSIIAKSGNQFVKRDVVIMVRKFDPYTGEPSFDELNTPKFSFMNEKCQQLDKIKVGEIVNISFDVRGRAYEKDGKKDYLTDVNPFSIVPDKQNYQVQQEAYQQMAEAQAQQPMAQSPQQYQQPIMQQPQQSPQYNSSYPSSPYGQNVATQPPRAPFGENGDNPF
ncbi:MAG: DUF3127 domain-containing protein [Clostridia bacterium]|nr:DUF3127 domain-containing protein [Clostridia bacterium]